MFLLLLLPILKKGGSHVLRVLSQIAKKVGDACPQGAFKNRKKRWRTHVLRVLSNIAKKQWGTHVLRMLSKIAKIGN
jgi:hypothetical protein